MFGLASIAACGGISGDPGPNTCVDEAAERLGDDSQSKLGFSAAEVMEFASAPRFELMRAGDPTPLSAAIALRLRPDSVRFISTRQSWDIGMSEVCRGRVEFDVDVELTVPTANGDRTLSTTGRLAADSRHRARLTAQFSEDAFHALRAIELAAEESFDSLRLHALLTPAGSSGELTAELASLVRVGPQPEPTGDAPRARDYTATRSARIAWWPAVSPCAPGELPLERDQSLFELSPAQVVQMLTEPKTLRWEDGGNTTFTIEATDVGTTCLAEGEPDWFWPISWPALAPEDPALFGVPLELSITTEDGRFRTNASVMLQYRARKTGGLDEAWVEYSAELEPGDTGGWTADEADLSTARSTLLQLRMPAGDRGSQLYLHGQPESVSSCDGGHLCSPPSAPIVIVGFIE